MFDERDRDRVDLLASRATWDPDPDWILHGAIFEERSEHLVLERLERIRIAKELRDVNEEIVVQLFERVGVRAKVLCIGRQLIEAAHRHAALDAPANRG